MRVGYLVVVGVMVGAALAITTACTGSDTTSPAAPGASASSSGAGAEAGSGTSSGNPPSGAGTYGVFLTHETFLTDFGLAASDAGDRFAFIDAKCIAAAAEARLANAERYKAIVTMYSQQANLDLPRLLKFGTIGQKDGARWCAIAKAPSPHADCAVGDGAIIFGNSLDVQLGPLHPLYSDEYGDVQVVTTFHSGYVIPPGSTAQQGAIRNCNGWTNKVPDITGDAGAPEGVEFAFGFGTTQAVPRTPSPVPFAWLATAAYCEQRYRLPLLCIEVPAGD